jgi:hypothetical protein
LLTAGYDTIGAITVKPEDDEMFRLLYWHDEELLL